MTPKRHPLKAVSHVSLLLHNLNKEAERRTGLSIVQWSILKHLIDMPASSAQELSEAVRLHPSTLTQSLKRLDRKGQIFMAEDPRDSRKKIISLTRKGKNALDHSEREMKHIMKDIAAIEKELYVVEEGLSLLRYQGSESEGVAHHK